MIVGLIGFTGCTHSEDAKPAKCSAKKCDSSKKCDSAKKCDASKKESKAKKCDSGKCSSGY
jgi:hypothetical protein